MLSRRACADRIARQRCGRLVQQLVIQLPHRPGVPRRLRLGRRDPGAALAPYCCALGRLVGLEAIHVSVAHHLRVSVGSGCEQDARDQQHSCRTGPRRLAAPDRAGCPAPACRRRRWPCCRCQSRTTTRPGLGERQGGGWQCGTWCVLSDSGRVVRGVPARHGAAGAWRRCSCDTSAYPLATRHGLVGSPRLASSAIDVALRDRTADGSSTGPASTSMVAVRSHAIG